MELSPGCRIAYILPNGYYEEEIASVKVDKQEVNSAKPGEKAGVKTIYSKEQLKAGTIVYKVEL